VKILKKAMYENVIDEIFKSQFSIGIEEEKDSLSADVKRQFKEEGLLNEN
jgi:hypothetical protein